MIKDTSGPAFPVPDIDGGAVECGMTLRDYFAAKAMQASVSHAGVRGNNGIAKWAYEMADAMLKAREA